MQLRFVYVAVIGIVAFFAIGLVAFYVGELMNVPMGEYVDHEGVLEERE